MSANVTTTSITPALLEVVDRTIYEYVNKTANSYTRWGAGQGKDINARGAFVVGESLANPSWGGFAEGGLYPDPGAQTLQKMTISYQRQGQTNRLTKDALQSKAGQLSETLARNIQSDTNQFLKQCNRMMFQNGNGAIGIVLSSTGATITFDTPFYGTQFIVGGAYQVYTTAGVLRGAQTEVYKVLSKSGAVVTFDTTIATSGTGGAVAAGDIVCYKATYGLEANGFPYHINNSLTGSYQGITKTSLPEGFIPVAEDAGGGNISVALIERNKGMIKYKPGNTLSMKHFFLSSPTQINSYLSLGGKEGANTIWRAQQSGRTLDLQWSAVEYCGDTFFEDIDCPDDTLYFMHDQIIARYEYKKLGPETFDGNDSGSLLWPIPGFASGVGNWYDQRMMITTIKENWGSVNPASAFVINNLSTGPYANRGRMLQ